MKRKLIYVAILLAIGSFLYCAGYSKGQTCDHSIVIKGNTVEDFVPELPIDNTCSSFNNQLEHLETLLSLKNELIDAQNKNADLLEGLFQKYKKLYELEISINDPLALFGNVIQGIKVCKSCGQKNTTFAGEIIETYGRCPICGNVLK